MVLDFENRYSPRTQMFLVREILLATYQLISIQMNMGNNLEPDLVTLSTLMIKYE